MASSLFRTLFLRDGDSEDSAADPSAKRRKQSHDPTHKREFKCTATPPCSQTFTTNKAQLRHVRESLVHQSADSMAAYSCKICSMGFPRRESRDRHENEYHNGQRRAGTRDQRHARSNHCTDVSACSTTKQGCIATLITHHVIDTPRPAVNHRVRTLKPDFVDIPALLAAARTANPRRMLPDIKCPICRTPFECGEHGQLTAHIAKHFRALKTKHTCTECDISFMLVEDLRRHLNSAKRGHCGFAFTHLADCTGHHPPPYLADGRPREFITADDDRVNFCFRIRSWEQTQLREFNRAIESLRVMSLQIGALGLCQVSSTPERASAQLPQLERYPDHRSEPGDAHSEWNTIPFDQSFTSSSIVSKPMIPAWPKTVRDVDSLSRAVCAGDKNLVQSLFDHNANPDHRDCNGLFPLHYTILFGFQDICSLLLDQGASPNVRDRHMNTLLSLAISRHNTNIAEMLLMAGADVNGRDAYGNTPLHTSSCFVDSSCVTLLLQHGANVNLTCQNHRRVYDSKAYTLPYQSSFANGDTALHIAGREGRQNTVRLLLENDADPRLRNTYGESALCQSLHSKKWRCAQLLLDYGAPASNKELTMAFFTPIFADDERSADEHFQLATHDSWNLFASLCKAGASLEGDLGPHVLSQACASGSMAAVVLCVNRHVKPDVKSLCAALDRRHYRIVEYLLKLGINPNGHGVTLNGRSATPLVLAITQGNKAMVQLLLKHGADANLASGLRSDANSISPLALAVLQRESQLVEVLTAYRADPVKQIAIGGCYVEYYLSSGNLAKSLHSTDKNTASALQLARCLGLRTIEMLLQRCVSNQN